MDDVEKNVQIYCAKVADSQVVPSWAWVPIH